VQAKRRSNKRAYLCFDEWNVWYKNHQADGEGQLAAHLLEEVYNLEDALVVAGFLHSFLRHADVLKIANLAQVVNVIAPVLTREDAVLAQSIFYPFAMFAARRDGVSLQVALDGPSYESKNYGKATVIDASAILGDGVLHVFLTNRSLEEAAEVIVEVADRAMVALHSGEMLSGTDPKAANTFERPDLVTPHPFTEVRIANGRATVALPSCAVAALTFVLA